MNEFTLVLTVCHSETVSARKYERIHIGEQNFTQRHETFRDYLRHQQIHSGDKCQVSKYKYCLTSLSESFR